MRTSCLRFAKINVPTVLLAGELDQVDSIERHKTEVLAYIPNAEFKIVNGGGYLIPIDEPLQLANEIGSFVGKLAPWKSFQDREAWTLNFQETSDVDKDSKASDF